MSVGLCPGLLPLAALSHLAKPWRGSRRKAEVWAKHCWGWKSQAGGPPALHPARVPPQPRLQLPRGCKAAAAPDMKHNIC